MTGVNPNSSVNKTGGVGKAIGDIAGQAIVKAMKAKTAEVIGGLTSSGKTGTAVMQAANNIK